ncbi:MAG TPA: hypothetical protein VI432_01720 [Candidatus Paceibacterota bacterium]
MDKAINTTYTLLKFLILVAVAIIILFTLIRAGYGNEPFVPGDFLIARERGALLAEEIVALSQASINNLKDIGSQDAAGNYTLGLNLIIEEIARNEEARNKAISLSKELEAMAIVLPSIKPSEALNVGTQAILSESQIVQRLINYNDYIYQLLNVLRSRFNKIKNVDSGREIKELIDKMNQEASSINELNEKYKSLMFEFDNLTSSQ